MPAQAAQRLGELPPYLFVEIDRGKRAALEAGRDVIDFGVGDPERPTYDFIIDRHKRAVEEPVHHRYPPGVGMAAFREAVGRFFHKRYGVDLNAGSEVLALIGSKEGLGHLPLAVLNPGEVALVPDPGYPVYHSATLFAGGIPHPMPLDRETWLPDLAAIPRDVAARARLLFLNYPNNPTGAVASRSFFEEALAFAREHDLLVVQDAAYNEMYHEADDRPPSILELPGARDWAVELHSLSKTFNMTGWRVAFAVGNATALAALAKVKANVDSGVFGAVQEAAIAALDGSDHPQVLESRLTYGTRARVLAAGLRELGFAVREPRATFYVWAGVPNAKDSMAFAKRLLDEADIVCIPGIGFGPNGEGFVRFAMTVSLERIEEALERLRGVTL